MPATWTRVNPGLLAVLTPVKGGTMIMATIAKKHLTIFTRSRRAPGAGRPDVKAAFTDAAEGTRGIERRIDRNKVVQSGVISARVKTGIYRRKSRAGPKSPLYGTVYVINTKTGTVTKE